MWIIVNPQIHKTLREKKFEHMEEQIAIITE